MPQGQWEPPEAGDAPQTVKDILKNAYSNCRDQNPSETPEAKEKCAKIAWGAVANAGWRKNAEGKWIREILEIKLLASEQEVRESFEWVPNMEKVKKFNKESKGGKLYAVKALHEGMTDPKDVGHGPRKYTADQLKRSALTLVGKLLNWNHVKQIASGRNEVIDAEWNDREGAIEAIAYIEDVESQEAIAAGKVLHVSVQGGPRIAKTVGGVAVPEGIVFDGLALVTEDQRPGDPDSSIRLIEVLGKQMYTPSKEFLEKLEAWAAGGYKEQAYPWEDCIKDQKAAGADCPECVCAAIKNRTVAHTAELRGISIREALPIVVEQLRTNPQAAYLAKKLYEKESSLNKKPPQSSHNMKAEELKVHENLDSFLQALEGIQDMPDDIKMQLASLAKQLYGQQGETKKVLDELKAIKESAEANGKALKELQEKFTAEALRELLSEKPAQLRATSSSGFRVTMVKGKR